MFSRLQVEKSTKSKLANQPSYWGLFADFNLQNMPAAVRDMKEKMAM